MSLSNCKHPSPFAHLRGWTKEHKWLGKTAIYSAKLKKHFQWGTGRKNMSILSRERLQTTQWKWRNTCSEETRRKHMFTLQDEQERLFHVPLLVLEPCNLQVFQAVNPPLHQVLWNSWLLPVKSKFASITKSPLESYHYNLEAEPFASDNLLLGAYLDAFSLL